jgi:hypothetical protein
MVATPPPRVLASLMRYCVSSRADWKSKFVISPGSLSFREFLICTNFYVVSDDHDMLYV